MGSVMDQERPWERDDKPKPATLRGRIEDAVRRDYVGSSRRAVDQIIDELERLEAEIQELRRK
ncbi:hypothetical protein [Rhizobium phage RHph_X2_26]|nr:hypothetical protein [Rhizobium phage RHph_X2_26]